MRNAVALIILAALAVGGTCNPVPANDGSQEILQSRKVWEPQMERLGEAMLPLSSNLDEARHRVRRGDDMRSALDVLNGRAGAVYDEAQAAVRASAEANVHDAAAIVEDVAADAKR